MKWIIRAIITLIALLCVNPIYSQSDESIKNKFMGTWKVVSVMKEETPGGKKIVDPDWSNPRGYLNYSPDGRMIVLIIQNTRKQPANTVATPNEAEGLFRTMTSYAGTYTIQDNQIIHHVDISWNQAWAGTNQVRFFKFEGNHLILTVPPSPDPKTGKMITHSLTWEKVSEHG